MTRVLVLPVTGEVVTVVDASTPEVLVFESLWPPDARHAPAHVHPAQEERFTVLEGVVHLRAGTDEHVLQAGDSLAVPPGVPHRGRSATGAGARLRLEFRPALRWLAFVERLAALPPEDLAGAGALVRDFADVVRPAAEEGA